MYSYIINNYKYIHRRSEWGWSGGRAGSGISKPHPEFLSQEKLELWPQSQSKWIFLVKGVGSDRYPQVRFLLSFPDSTDDVVIWSQTSTGIHSIKSVYLWLSDVLVVHLSSPKTWACIWNMKISETLKHFFWLLLHGSIWTNHVFFKRHLSFDLFGNRCVLEEETIIHLLHDCNSAKIVWRVLDIDGANNFFISAVKQWISEQLSTSNGSLFACACWWIWRARNSGLQWPGMVSVVYFKPDSCFAFHHLAWSCSVYFNESTHNVSWSPPEVNCIKVNIDGFSLGNPGDYGFGGILRDSGGQWLVVYSGFCGHTTNVLVEIMTTYQGLFLAWNSGYRHVICESDSMNALNLINNQNSALHPHAPLINRIRSFLDKPWTLS